MVGRRVLDEELDHQDVQEHESGVADEDAVAAVDVLRGGVKRSSARVLPASRPARP